MVFEKNIEFAENLGVSIAKMGRLVGFIDTESEKVQRIAAAYGTNNRNG